MDAPAAEPTTFDRNDGLRLELQRLDALLADHLARLRQRGRSALGELVKGAVIEDGEAEGLLRELAEAHRRDGAPAAGAGERPVLGGLTTLSHAALVYGLSRFERDVILLGLAVELDGRYGRLVAFLNDHAERARPTVGLAAALLGDGDLTGSLAPFLPNGRLTWNGLVELDGDGPLAGRPYKLSETFWPRLVEASTPLPVGELKPPVADALATLALPEEVRAQARAVVAWIREHGVRTLVIVKGPAGAGREALACAVAHELGAAALVAPAEALDVATAAALVRRDTRWFGAALVVVGGGGAPTRAQVAALRGLPVPALWITTEGTAEVLVSDEGRAAVELTLPEPDVELRTAMWRARLPQSRLAADVDLPFTASRFRFGPGRIEAAAAMATARAGAFRGDRMVGTEELSEVCRSLPEVRLSTLAQRLQCPFTRAELVVPPETDREIDLAIAWARHRGWVLSRWGHGRPLVSGRGLVCLFSGPPGTGKTMGAQVLAREIGLDVYRIDLSQVVSKYIGETEKNLTKVFEEAHAANVILFFDEADALFGKRTEVKDAHDRYANVETGFLLQRMEQHDGVCILATNLRRNMDDAFLRRLHIVADFPMPGEGERRRIWQQHLPSAPMLGDDVDLDLVSRKFVMSGGEIRNAVVAAAFLAAAESSPVKMRHVVLGLWRELKKGGRVLDPSEFGPWAPLVIALADASRRR